jgi:LPXTG-motif cell wall-anchored protein
LTFISEEYFFGEMSFYSHSTTIQATTETITIYAVPVNGFSIAQAAVPQNTKLSNDSASSPPTTPPTTPPTQLSAGQIAGVAIGAVLGVLLIALGIFFWWRRRRQAKARSQLFSPKESGSGAPEVVHHVEIAGFERNPELMGSQPLPPELHDVYETRPQEMYASPRVTRHEMPGTVAELSAYTTRAQI